MPDVTPPSPTEGPTVEQRELTGKRGRCAVNSALHYYDDGHECRRFMDVQFAKALGIEDSDA